MASFDLNHLKKRGADLFQNYIEARHFQQKGNWQNAPLCVGLILLGHWLEQKTAPQKSAAMLFLLISLNFKQKVVVVKISINFSWTSNHFDT